MIPRPTKQEAKAMSRLYAPQRTIISWSVIHCNKVVYECESAGMAEWWMKNNGLVNAYKKPVYEN